MSQFSFLGYVYICSITMVEEKRSKSVDGYISHNKADLNFSCNKVDQFCGETILKGCMAKVNKG